MTNKKLIPMFVAFLTLVPACTQDVNLELLDAAKNGRTERVKELLDAGADVGTKTDDGITALWWAVVRGHTGIVQALLDAGADVNARDNRDQTLLFLAEGEGQTRVIALLKAAGAKE